MYSFGGNRNETGLWFITIQQNTEQLYVPYTFQSEKINNDTNVLNKAIFFAYAWDDASDDDDDDDDAYVLHIFDRKICSVFVHLILYANIKSLVCIVSIV